MDSEDNRTRRLLSEKQCLELHNQLVEMKANKEYATSLLVSEKQDLQLQLEYVKRHFASAERRSHDEKKLFLLQEEALKETLHQEMKARIEAETAILDCRNAHRDQLNDLKKEHSQQIADLERTVLELKQNLEAAHTRESLLQDELATLHMVSHGVAVGVYLNICGWMFSPLYHLHDLQSFRSLYWFLSSYSSISQLAIRNFECFHDPVSPSTAAQGY